ncbi:MAG TPA: hypothetical protein VJJ23_04860 [Candidatus Nanoarchaeia archaeon]|nr:hypothetical protein [uncultured archaeon]AQS34161.1 hypothetical protein [uncultured archaeon]HLC56539.1 hypothetical protein [Candidatus Nanoarchaeia archaeon]
MADYEKLEKKLAALEREVRALKALKSEIKKLQRDSLVNQPFIRNNQIVTIQPPIRFSSRLDMGSTRIIIPESERSKIRVGNYYYIGLKTESPEDILNRKPSRVDSRYRLSVGKNVASRLELDYEKDHPFIIPGYRKR